MNDDDGGGNESEKKKDNPYAHWCPADHIFWWIFNVYIPLFFVVVFLAFWYWNRDTAWINMFWFMVSLSAVIMMTNLLTAIQPTPKSYMIGEHPDDFL